MARGSTGFCRTGYLGAPMDPYYQPHISNYSRKAKYHYVCPVCGTELFKDTEIASCEACGCDELNSVSDVREVRIPVILAACLAAIAVGLALVNSMPR